MSLQKTIDWVNDIVTKNKRRKMIEKVAEQKVKQQPNYSSNIPMELKLNEKFKVAKDLKTKMKQKGVY